MFCGRSEKEVPLLLRGLDACICSECVKLAGDYLKDIDRSVASSKPLGKVESLHKPKEIHQFLDQYVIGRQGEETSVCCRLQSLQAYQQQS